MVVYGSHNTRRIIWLLKAVSSCCRFHIAGAQDDGGVFQVNTKAAGYSPNVMVAQSNYDDPDPKRLFVINIDHFNMLPSGAPNYPTSGKALQGCRFLR